MAVSATFEGILLFSLNMGANKAGQCSPATRCSEKDCTMDLLSKPRSIKDEFEAQVTAALMIQSNALIPIKLAVRLCGIPRQEILKRIEMGIFPLPAPLTRRRKTNTMAFYLRDLHQWIKNPKNYCRTNDDDNGRK